MFLKYSAEGTTTNGDFLLPFKTGGFLAKAPVLPVILKYPYQRFSPAWDSISGVSTYIVIKHVFQLLLIINLILLYSTSKLLCTGKYVIFWSYVLNIFLVNM